MSDRVQSALDRMRLSTIRWRVPNICRMTMANLKKIGAVPPAEWGGKPLRGKTAVLVGAGDSLERDLDTLKKWQGKCAIFTVNTVAPRLYAEGIRPDYLVVLESLPMADQVHTDKVGTVIADMSSHTDVFDKAHFWTLGSSPHNLPILAALDVPPTWTGGAAMTTAFSVAVDWGADRIVLVGMGLGHTQETGDEYPGGTGWEGLKYEKHGDRVLFAGREDRDDLHREYGVPPVPRDRPAIECEAWGGGQAWTVMELESQRRWLSGYAEVLRDRIELVNTSVGGTRLDGFDERLLEDVELPDPTSPGEPERHPVDPQPAIERLKLEAERASKLHEAALSPKPDWSKVTELSDGIQFVQGLAAGDFVGLSEQNMKPPARIRGIYTIIDAAADAIEKEMGGDDA